MTNEELVASYLSGDDGAFKQLAENFSSEIKGLSRKYYIIGGDESDVAQLCMLGLLDAARSYSSTYSDKSFKNFAYMCMVRNVVDGIRSSNRRKNAPLNDAVSIFAVSDFGEITESKLIEKEDYLALRSFLEGHLSRTERRVLDLYLDGETYEKMASALELNVKAVDNALLRIRNKIRKDYLHRG